MDQSTDDLLTSFFIFVLTELIDEVDKYKLVQTIHSIPIEIV